MKRVNIIRGYTSWSSFESFRADWCFQSPLTREFPAGNGGKRRYLSRATLWTRQNKRGHSSFRNGFLGWSAAGGEPARASARLISHVRSSRLCRAFSASLRLPFAHPLVGERLSHRIFAVKAPSGACFLANRARGPVDVSYSTCSNSAGLRLMSRMMLRGVPIFKFRLPGTGTELCWSTPPTVPPCSPASTLRSLATSPGRMTRRSSGPSVSPMSLRRT